MKKLAEGKIVTERYISAGDGILSIGMEAFIKFHKDENIFWMYAVLMRLSANKATFKLVYGKGRIYLKAYKW